MYRLDLTDLGTGDVLPSESLNCSDAKTVRDMKLKCSHFNGKHLITKLVQKLDNRTGGLANR